MIKNYFCNVYVTFWKKHVFKELFSTTDAILYVDTDSLFLSDPELYWNKFRDFKDIQIAGMTTEHEDIKGISVYSKDIKMPYYGVFGLNAGIMMMNLTRMREFQLSEKLVPLYYQYKDHIPWGDQCLLNILFSKYPCR